MREFPGLTPMNIWDLALWEWWGIATATDQLIAERTKTARNQRSKRKG